MTHNLLEFFFTSSSLWKEIGQIDGLLRFKNIALIFSLFVNKMLEKAISVLTDSISLSEKWG